ncbi:hypothetical protein FN846DRAFT_686656 [Sphaerosporella brunnea]|uniref:Uncharacterized protein n=1 Tax=Sphaerosporella brunnea TaxID=1250544 RepID=A0A5J5EZ20_9PEZI|nr:hypothetical protein FN846DRAFT_686656 [Sphaerosporella brunnea]
MPLISDSNPFSPTLEASEPMGTVSPPHYHSTPFSCHQKHGMGTNAPKLATSTRSFEQYPPGSILHGRLGFYIKTMRADGGVYGKLRGLTYQKQQLIGDGSAALYSTESSCVGLHDGEGYVGDVEIHILEAGGVFVVKLKGKNVYVIEEDEKLLVAKKASRSQATRFMLQLADGMMLPVTLSGGRRWYDNGVNGWNTGGKGDQLWLEFASEAERQQNCRKSSWGVWQPEQIIHWP